MNLLFDPDEYIFLSYEQESDWKKKWLEQRISILEARLKNLNTYTSQITNKKREDSFECCSRTRPPPAFCAAQCITLRPIYQKYTNPSNLVNSSYAPITPIWKTDYEQKYSSTANESDSDSYFKEDHPLIYDFSKEDAMSDKPEIQENPSLSTTSHIQQEKPSDSVEPAPKYVPQKKCSNNLILTPGWTKCNPIKHSDTEDSASMENEMNSFESRCKKAHIDIEIVQRRIKNHQTNMTIEESNIHDSNDQKIFPTEKESKIERKYICKSYKRQVPPNWEPRSYDSPEDLLNEKEIDLWKKLTENELSKKFINNDAISKGLKLKCEQIRTPDRPISNET